MEPTPEHKRVLADIAMARTARSHFAPLINAFYELAVPDRQHVDNDLNISTPRPPGAQDDIFDGTLQQAVRDFASEFADEFTPGYRDWTRHQAADSVPSGFKKQVDDYITARSRLVYDAIRLSGFEEASQDVYVDAAIAPSAVHVRYTRAGRPIDVEYVPTRELLILPGPYGGVGHRYRERSVRVRDLDVVHPDCNWAHVQPTAQLRKDHKGSVKVVEGGYRDWTAEQETWRWFVIHEGKVRKEYTFTGPGSCPLTVVRIYVSAPSAYGAGPASLALAPARTLNELSYLELKRAGKIVDPPGVFVDPTGTFNPEEGFDAGKWYEAGDGFEKYDLAPVGDIREVFLKREELRMAILRALWQDKPYQRGDTPPTATQWAGEQASTEKRKALPRARIHREWTLPLIERFEWVLSARGELEPLLIDGRMINIRPVSPLSKAADLEDAQLAMQLLGVIMQGGEPLSMSVDTATTYAEMQKRFGDRVVKLLTAKERQAMQQQMMAAQMAAAGGAGG